MAGFAFGGKAWRHGIPAPCIALRARKCKELIAFLKIVSQRGFQKGTKTATEKRRCCVIANARPDFLKAGFAE